MVVCLSNNTGSMYNTFVSRNVNDGIPHLLEKLSSYNTLQVELAHTAVT